MRYANCKWCGGRGCLYCAAEKEKAIKRQQDIQPIFTADPTNEKDMELLRSLFGAEAIKDAWEKAQESPNPRDEFARLMTLNGLIGKLTQLARRENTEATPE